MSKAKPEKDSSSTPDESALDEKAKVSGRPRYRVKGPGCIIVGSTWFAPGDYVELTDEQALPLLDLLERV